MRASIDQSGVAITPYHFTAIRMVAGLSLAAYFVGIHLAYNRIPVSIPGSIPRGVEWQEFLQSCVLAAKASTWFCITGVAASLLLALGYYRRIFAALILVRLLVVVYGHWLQELSIVFPVFMLCWFCIVPHGEPLSMLQSRCPDWKPGVCAAAAFWIAASLATGIFLAAAILMQIRLIHFQGLPRVIRSIKLGTLGISLAAVLTANPWLAFRQQTRGIVWAVNLAVVPVLALTWLTDHQQLLRPRLWLPWGLSTCALYFLIWLVLLDHGLLPGRPAKNATRHIVFYDGLCPLCHATLNLLIREDIGGCLHYAPLQGKTAGDVLGEDSIKATGPNGSVVYVRNAGQKDEMVFHRSTAAIQALRDIGGFFGFLAATAGLLPAGLRDAVYRTIAAHRSRIFGSYTACPPPPEGAADRFLP